MLCGESYRPTEGILRRVASKRVTIQTTSAKELTSKRLGAESAAEVLQRSQTPQGDV